MNTPRSRMDAILQARRELDCRPLFLDTETTGLGVRDQIVEVCVVEADGSILFETFVKPTVRLPVDVIAIHHITEDMVASAPAWPEVWQLLEPCLAGRRIATFNADFDLRMIFQSHAAHRLPCAVEHSRFLCLMRLYAQFRGEWDPRHRSYRWHSLEAASRHCALQGENSHRARADALLARELLLFMAQCAG